jgi:hypothetical protein
MTLTGQRNERLVNVLYHPSIQKDTAYVGHVATNTRVRPRDKRTSFTIIPWLHNQFGCSTGYYPLMPWLNSNSGQSYRSRRNRCRTVLTVCSTVTYSMHSSTHTRVNHGINLKVIFRTLSTCRLGTQELHFYTALSL